MQFWSGDHLAIEVSGPGGASEVVVQRPYALIGALARADVRVSGDGVQKREALLYALDGKVMCRRLEAALPEAYTEVTPGKWLSLGQQRLRVRIIHNGPDSRAIDLDAKLRIPVLRVRHKAHASVNRRLHRPIETVGRGGDCELELRCPQASLFHCILLREGNRLWCVDLGSGNGTLLNGERIECAQVEMGNKLRVGDFELEFQRYSRRSDVLLRGGDNPAGSNLSLSSPVQDDHLADLVFSRSGVDVPPGESIFGSKIINSTATPPGPASSLSGLAALAAPPPGELQFLQDKQAELLAAQAELVSKLDELTAENARLRADQEALSQQRAALSSDLLQRMEQLRGSTAQEISAGLETLKLSLEQQWLAHRAEASESAATQTASLQQSLMHELQQRLEALGQTQLEQVFAESRAQRDPLAKELAQRIDDWTASQAQQLKLQNDAQRLALTQELTRRIDAALERSVQPVTSQEPEQEVVSSQWLQRLDDLRSAQSDEIALAIGNQGQALSQRLAAQLDDLQKSLAKAQQDQAEQLEAHIAATRELLAQSTSQLQGDLKDQQARLVADQAEKLRQSLSHDLSRQVESQHASLSQDLLGQLESLRSAGADQQQANVGHLDQRIEQLQAALQQLLGQQSQFAARLSSQADELKAARRELRELQSRPTAATVEERPEPQPDWQAVEVADTPAETAIVESRVLTTSDAAEQAIVEPEAQFLVETTALAHSPQRKPPAIDEDDPLLHFVSDRLAQLDTGRQRRVIIYWSIGVAVAVLLAALAWALLTWLPGDVQQS